MQARGQMLCEPGEGRLYPEILLSWRNQPANNTLATVAIRNSRPERSSGAAPELRGEEIMGGTSQRRRPDGRRNQKQPDQPGRTRGRP